MITLEEQIEECRRSAEAMRRLVARMERDRTATEGDLRAVRDGLELAEAILATMESVPGLMLLLEVRDATAAKAPSLSET